MKRVKMGWSPSRTLTYSQVVLWILSHLLIQGLVASCPEGFFPCKDSGCIRQAKHCDGNKDCNDGSDEVNCGDIHCHAPDFFRCHNGLCVSSFFVCDGDNHCGDGSDELDCHLRQTPAPGPAECMNGEFRCADNLCIPENMVCDGKPHCLDGSDETIGCSKRISCDGFLCDNHHCVPEEWVCDGQDDCLDNSDEKNCGDKNTSSVPMKDCILDKGLFACHDHMTCIELGELCDGTKQCLDGSDEGLACNSSKILCPQFGCSYRCVPSPTTPLCICQSGYTLKDIMHCEDNDECLQYGICSQKCNNKPGTYQCSCAEGYALQDNNMSCKAEGGEAVLMFSTKNRLHSYYLTSRVYFPVVKNGDHIVGVAYDGLHVYWTSLINGEEAIVRSQEDGSVVETLVTSGLSLPEDLAVDWVTSNIYFTDSEEKHIGVCTATGFHCTSLVNEDIDSPRAIALLIAQGLMFWSDWGVKPMIARAGMDGSSPTAFVNSDIHWPNGLALDQGNDRLYWIDSKLSIIESIKFDGTDRRAILKGIAKHPYALAVFEDTLYWSDFQNSEILSCNKFTGKDLEKILFMRRSYIYGINIYHPSLHPKVENPCNTAQCSDICLLAPNNTYSCACPQDKELSVDKHSCMDLEKRQVMIMAGGHTVFEVQHQSLGRQHYSSMSMKLVYKIGAVTYNSLSGMLILSDIAQKQIFTLHLQTTRVKKLITSGIGTIEGMDFDYLGNNLYWCDTEHQTVEALSFSTMERKVLLRLFGEEIPLDIAVIPEEGVMFIALKHEYDTERLHIDRLHMDGSGRTHVIENILVGPTVSLTYDQSLRRVFWCDSGRGTIESTDVDGTDHHGYRALDSPPMAVATLGRDIFWTTWESTKLHWANKYLSDSKIKSVSLDAFEGIDKIVLVAVWGIRTPPNHPCQEKNGGCSHLCLLSLKQMVCACPEGMILESDNHTCARPAHCAKNQYRCQHDNLCIPRNLWCNGRVECPSGEDEKDCRTVCHNNQFACANGQCIYKGYHCDGSEQCTDGSDESGCGKCDTENQFQCDTGECIDVSWRCDLKPDCQDESDERDCEPATCQSGHFRCKSGACIAASWECDGEMNCADGSDEHDKCSPVTCSPRDFTCTNKRCVDQAMQCNGMDDCGDNSDESNCQKPTSADNKIILCSDDEFRCILQSNLCIPSSARCNGTAECPKGEDERDCGCGPHQFQCENTMCIFLDWACDGTDDCGDGSDEDPSRCVTTVKPTTGPCQGYQCTSGECLSMDHVCNEAEDCADSSDEGGRCRYACTTGHPCQGVCHATPAGPRCSCEAGYVLKGDGSSCEDVNECLDNGVCSQVCTNSEGSFACSCVKGYALKLDRRSCKATGTPMEIVFVANGNEIRKVPLSLSYMNLIHRDNGLQITGLDADARTRTVYWTSGARGVIYSHLLANQQTLTSNASNVGRPTRLVVDWITGNVYYVDEDVMEQSYIKVCNTDLKLCAKVMAAEPGTEITSMAIDPLSGYLFWSETSYAMFNNPSSTIHRAELSGENAEVVVSGKLVAVSGLEADPIRRRLYWADHVEQLVEGVTYTGEGRHILFSHEAKHPNGLVLFEDDLYWMSAGSGKMMKCRLFGKPHRCEWIQLNAYNTEHFTIMQEERQPQGKNSCLERICNHLCVLGIHGPKCLCEDGSLESMDVPCKGSNTVDTSHPLLPDVLVPLESAAASSGWSTAGTVFIILLILALVVAGYITYQRKWKGKGKFDISISFKNPAFGFAQNGNISRSSTPHLKPGQHEYVNPIDATGELQNVECADGKGYNSQRPGILKKLIRPAPLKAEDSDEEYADSEYSENQTARLIP